MRDFRRIVILVDQLGGIEDAWHILTAPSGLTGMSSRTWSPTRQLGSGWSGFSNFCAGCRMARRHCRVEVGYLHGLAIAAAIRVRSSCIIRVPVTDGRIAIPTVEVLRIAESSSVQMAELRCADGEIEIYPLDAVHRHRTETDGRAIEIELDNSTPYREFSRPAPPLRLGEDELATWRAHLDAAWRVLVRYHPQPATELAGILRTVVPTSRPLIGSSSAQAFGAVIASMPISSIVFAETLVHELRHSQLNAVADLVDLTCGDDTFYAPWREDPRPLFGLLHGIYAFAGSVEFWSTECQHSAGPKLRESTFLFAYRRAQVRQAIDAVVTTPYLTDTGRMLVKSATERIDTCGQRSLPDGVLVKVDQIMSDHRARWRISHL